MREPTLKMTTYAWHAAALAGQVPPVHPNEPQCGFFKTRLVKKGPWVAARIWLDQEIDEETGELLGDERLQCEVNGGYAEAEDQWIWLCGNPITEAEFNYLTALREHTERYEPDHPSAKPREAVDNLKTPILF